MQDQNMVELFEGGLQNDSIPETFKLRCTMNNGELFPIRFLKILPLLSWGPSFNFSIWFVELNGSDEPDLVRTSMYNFNMCREKEVIRLCLKHFRQQKYTSAYYALQAQTGVRLEDPFITKLHETLVKNGDYDKTENIMKEAIYNGLMSQYISRQEYRAVWKSLVVESTDEDYEMGDDTRPGMRGGHQMVMDPSTDTMYLFGGWDGKQDLSDLWSYHVPTQKWTLICRQTENVGGPSPRSCHKMCLDPERRQIFTLGRYLDTTNKVSDDLKKDFYVYDIGSNSWTLITEDTSSMGGPQLTFDHQICIDVAKKCLYVFGGRVLPYSKPDDPPILNTEPLFSGLYSYHIPTNTWELLLPDFVEPIFTNSIAGLRSRIAHSMLFHPGSRKLYIFGGQRNKEFLNSFLSYSVDTGVISIVSDMTQDDPRKMPPAGYTQRATLDPELNEIYILSGLSKEKEKRDDNIQHSFWVYSLTQNTWTCVYKNENTGEQYWKRMQYIEPCPRFAHQLVFDHVNKVHYLFGGNPGKSQSAQVRLDDFWELKLARPPNDYIMQKCKFLIRKYKFEELATRDSMDALRYLQTELYNVIDHQDSSQTKQFHKLATLLFKNDDQFAIMSPFRPQLYGHGEEMQEPAPGTSKSDNRLNDSDGESEKTDRSDEYSSYEARLHVRRSLLFNKLMDFFPESMVQPKINLSDLVLM